ncbi:MAG TPA: Hsp20/alpha crystallin family protein [Flavisolibacter sp.]|nr:Hsp20/alpha crystallin family protein [Flavisolibacter sp.]
MATRAITKPTWMPPVFEDFFRPWNQWFDDGGLINRVLTVPAVNISENGDQYRLTMAVPGLKKEDFKIDVAGNTLTIRSEKEEKKEDKDENYSRREYSYSSFSRSFTLPDDVKSEAIEARYSDGVLHIQLPKKEEAKKTVIQKAISVK